MSAVMNAHTQSLAERPKWNASKLLQSPVFLKSAAGLAIIGVWEAAVALSGSTYIAHPIGIAKAIPSVLLAEDFITAVAATLMAVAGGLCVAVVLGTFIGLSMGRVKVLDWAFSQYVNGFFAMPIIAIVPLIILWFGNTPEARLATIVVAAVFSVVLSARDGARSVPAEFLDVARVYHAGSWGVIAAVMLPASLPYLLAGIRLATGRALVGALVAEFLLSIDGIGFFIMVKSRTFNHNDAFVAVLCLALFGLAVDLLLSWVTSRALPWYGRTN